MTRETQELWSKRIQRWKDSGLTAREFAQELGINPHTLAYWRWRLKARPDNPPKTPLKRVPVQAGFVEVTVPAPSPQDKESEPPEPLELLLSGGLRLRIPVRFDETALRRVVATLGGS